MNPILLATDGSPSATEATREAIDLAHRLDVPLVVTAVEHAATPAYSGYYGYADAYVELAKAEHEHVEATLRDVAAQAAEAGVECEVVPLKGIVVDTICKLATKRRPELLVVGAHGWGPVKRLVFGSVSLGLLHEAPCPVLVAREAPKV